MWYHATGAKGRKDMVVLLYKDRLLLFSRYLQQLVMEPLGKRLNLKYAGPRMTIYDIIYLIARARAFAGTSLHGNITGSSAVSLGVLLGTFMGGMCLGSIALPRLVSSRHHPLCVYALLELGIGIFGIALLFGMPYVDHVYSEAAGTGLPATLLRGILCAACLLPPTVLMGATLPAIARWVETTPQGVSWLGLFYGGNIAGAVLGCLLAGFYLLRVHDMEIATYVAATLNGAVALLALRLWLLMPYDARPAGSGPRLRVSVRASWPVYLTIAISGMLRECGVRVKTLDVNRDLPDSTFVEDTAIVLDEAAVLASMGTEARQGELAGIERELRKYRLLHRVELPATIEGGDVLRVGRTLLVGLSSRTNLAGVQAFEAIVRRYGYCVLPVRVRGCLGNQAIRRNSSTLFRGVTATPSARSRAICLRPTDPSLVELTIPLAATTRNQGSRLDSSTVRVARMNATWRGVTPRYRAMVP
jgi:hypothetical protein